MLSTTSKDRLLNALLPAARAISNPGTVSSTHPGTDPAKAHLLLLIAQLVLVVAGSMLSTVLVMLDVNLVIYLFDYACLASLIGPGKAFVFGVQPFLWGDAMKLVVAACLMPVAWRAVKAMTGTSFSDRGQFQ